MFSSASLSTTFSSFSSSSQQSSASSHSTLSSSSDFEDNAPENAEADAELLANPAVTSKAPVSLKKQSTPAKLGSATKLKKKRKTPKNTRRKSKKREEARAKEEAEKNKKSKDRNPGNGSNAGSKNKVPQSSSQSGARSKRTTEPVKSKKMITSSPGSSKADPSNPDGSFEDNITVLGVKVSKKLLGQGTFASVHPGIHLKTGKRVAVKVVELDEYEFGDPDDISEEDEDAEEIASASKGDKKKGLRRGKGAEGARRGVLSEIRALEDLHHRNVVKLHYHQELYAMMFLVMEFAPGRNLSQLLGKRGRFSEHNARWIFGQVCSAVSYCHSKNIAHHDLKPANIIVDEHGMVVKLVDFGLCISDVPSNQKCEIFSGTPLYCALEILLRRPYNPYLADVWALGVVLYEMLCDALPWNAKSYDGLVAAVASGEIEFPFELSDQVVQLIAGMVEIRPSRRTTLEAVLGDAWVNDVW